MSLPYRIVGVFALAFALIGMPSLAAPFSVPGAADASRIDKREELQAPSSRLTSPAKPMKILSSAVAPEQSKHITMTLKHVKITGMTAFTEAEVEDIYADSIDHVITMDQVWVMAGALTERYRTAGYFLSRASVPQQDVKNGTITLHVVEGYIAEVKFDDPLKENYLIRLWLERLKSYRPLKADQLESVMLQLNDLPGVGLQAVLEPIGNDRDDGAVRLVLKSKPEARVTGQVSTNNYGSRFLGPFQASTQLQAVILPMQKTTATLLTAAPTKELRYGSLKQEIPVIPGGEIELYGTHTLAAPGYTLKSQEIRSDSTLLGVGFNYKLIRQREENLTGRIAFESRDTSSDILNTPLTRDTIRALRAGLTYETADGWNGYDSLSGTVSQGLDILGASPAGQLNLSRAQATPDFTKFEASFNRIQSLSPSWGLVTGAAMQVASGPLYSSEEFGYGGQAFGRAYDDSEITGDHGLAATAELRYTDIDPWYGVKAVPYGFYDIGIVWNEDRDQAARASGSSGGAGVKLLSDLGVSADFGIAFPLTRSIDNPLAGNGKNPRYTMQLSYGF